jgi:hypothetical protein
LTFSGAFFAFLGLVVRASLKSNCKNFSCCWGAFRCVRETTADTVDLEIGQPPVATKE